ncbi:hypothetical protein LOD99_12312 [Oopsacas minuta]|uniref:LisH domain-containing protein n=1 Tax=Oopsacas minuta TaxID=111878 RepID=A0AAV7JFT0_9METZ|nr:hypothetical protein LOD99_12312 [Oopsacas minuta]
MSDSPVSVTESSQEDVRSTLFSELKERGVLSSIKAQLRGKVVQELQSLVRDRPISCESATQRWGRLCVSILAEYLEITGLEYTLSILFIEGGCGREGIMGRGEIEDILRADLRGKYSVLTFLVEEMTKNRGIQKRDIHTQTHKSHTQRDCLEDKLMEIEHAYSELSEREREYSHYSMQEKMLAFQRQCQTRANEQVKSEMNRFKERELASMRLECESKMQDEIAKTRRQTEMFYQERLKGLQQRERNMMEGMKKRETELDATLFSQRQKILDELESVKNRELEARRILEAEDRGVKGERERLMCLEQNLKLRELNLENTNKQNEITNQHALSAKQVRLEKEYQDKLKYLELQEATLKEEKRSLSQLEGICSHQIKETTDLRSQLFKLQEAVYVSTEAQLLAEKDKSILSENLERMGDYNVLKSETVRLENELYMTKLDVGKNQAIKDERLREYEILISELRSKLQEPSEDVRELHNKLVSEKHSHKREQILQQQENKQLQSQLETAVYQQRCLKETLRDHQMLVKQLNHELSDLRVRTANSTRTRETHFDSHPIKSSLRNQTLHSAPPLFTHTKDQPDLLNKPKLSRVRIKLPTNNITETAFNDTGDISLAGSDVSFVQEAKSSLERLEREALELEHSYKQVHSRILRGTAMDKHYKSTDIFQDFPYASTLDPNAFLQQIQFQSRKELKLPTEIPTDKSLPSFSLTSLTDINLTAGVNISPLDERNKSTGVFSSYTTQDNFPSMPSYNQLLSNPTHISLSSDSKEEMNQIYEVSLNENDTSVSPLVIQTNQLNDNPPLVESMSPDLTASTSIDPIRLFHRLQDTTGNEPTYSARDNIPINNQSNALQTIDVTSTIHAESNLPLDNVPTHQSNERANPTVTLGQSTDITQNTGKRIEFISSEVKHNPDANTIPMEDYLALDIISRTNEISARAKARDEAVRLAVERAEQLEQVQAEMDQFHKEIPTSEQVKTPAETVNEFDKKIIPQSEIFRMDTPLLMDTPAKPKTDLINTPIIPTMSNPILQQVGTPANPIEELEPSAVANPNSTQLSAKSDDIISQESTNIPEHSDSPVKSNEQVAIDPMATYMQLLTKSSKTQEEENTSTKANDEIQSGLDVSLKSDDVSYGGFSDADKTDPFKDW